MTKKIYKYLSTLIAILLFCPALGGRAEERDSVVVSLLTCWPGSEVYELCGHSAIRTRYPARAQSDTVWNYGVFDFNRPGFLYRFVKGETDYLLAGYPFPLFMQEYAETGRKVVEQRLNLSPEEARRLVGMLRTEALPENRTYRYNYIRDNCATRILDRLDSVSARKIIYPDSVEYGSFRREMRSYHRNYPWYQFGIDLALGSGLDGKITGREEMFVPLEMMKKVGEAHYSDGTPLVRSTEILYGGTDEATLPPTPWWLTPLFWSWVVFALGLGVSVMMFRRKRIFKGVYTIWYGICGIAGCLVAFLVFASSHAATSPNMLLIWLNPLQLLFAISVWSRRLRFAALAMAYLNIFALGIMLVIWPGQLQSANPAFFPLIGTTLILAITYVLKK